MVTVTNAAGCSATDDVVVNVSPQITANAGSDISICNGLSANIVASGGATYSWSPAAGLSNAAISNPVANPTISTTYTVTITDGGMCSATDAILVTVNAMPSASAGSDVNICSGNSATLNATGGSEYTWSPGTGLSATNISSPDAAPTMTTTYVVTVTNIYGCSATDDVVVNFNSTPVANAGNDITICNHESAPLLASGGTTYSWSNGIFTPANNVSPQITTTYNVTVSAASGCSATDNVVVNVKPYTAPFVFSNGPMGFCSGSTNPIILNAGNGYTSYLWSNGATSQTISVSTIGTYWVIGTAPNGCADTSASVQVQNFPAISPPIIIPDGPTDFCEGDTISVNLSTNNNYYTYHWNSGSFTPSILVTHASNNQVSVTDHNGCTGVSNMVHVGFIPKPVAYIYYGATGTLVDFFNFSLNGSTYQWNFGDGSTDTTENPEHTYSSTGVYSVLFIVSNICGSDTLKVTITLVSGMGISEIENINNLIVYPNPSNDHVNIMFNYSDLESMSINIINSLGQPIFSESDQINTGSYTKNIDFAAFSPGIYILLIQTDKGSVYRKLIKE